MNDTERFQQISKFIKIAKKDGIQYLSDALTVAEGIEDPDDKPSYIAIIAAHLAKLGSIPDIDRALQLSRKTRPIDQLEFVLPGVFFRLISENEIQRALDVLREMETAATEIESLDYDYSIKSTFWQEIGDRYKSIGMIEKARAMWLNSIKMAQVGQNSFNNIQDSVDSFKALRSLSLALLDAGYYQDALATANTIVHSGYKEEVLKKIKEHQNQAK